MTDPLLKSWANANPDCYIHDLSTDKIIPPIKPVSLTPDQRQSMAIALGERTGMDVAPDEIAIVGKWLFHNHPDYDMGEVDVYELPLPMCAEAWTSIPLYKSPFGTNDPATLQATINRIES
tara:strand:+ start:124 stop:486 length:363 start_codon:yes stop_codon:yes gene_type:complete